VEGVVGAVYYVLEVAMHCCGGLVVVDVWLRNCRRQGCTETLGFMRNVGRRATRALLAAVLRCFTALLCKWNLRGNFTRNRVSASIPFNDQHQATQIRVAALH